MLRYRHLRKNRGIMRTSVKNSFRHIPFPLIPPDFEMGLRGIGMEHWFYYFPPIKLPNKVMKRIFFTNYFLSIPFPLFRSHKQAVRMFGYQRKNGEMIHMVDPLSFKKLKQKHSLSFPKKEMVSLEGREFRHFLFLPFASVLPNTRNNPSSLFPQPLSLPSVFCLEPNIAFVLMPKIPNCDFQFCLSFLSFFFFFFFLLFISCVVFHPPKL